MRPKFDALRLTFSQWFSRWCKKWLQMKIISQNDLFLKGKMLIYETWDDLIILFHNKNKINSKKAMQRERAWKGAGVKFF